MSKLVKYIGQPDSRFSKDTIYTVERELDDEYIIGGVTGIHMKDNFAPYEIPSKRSEISEVVSALKTLESWNRNHPSALMISVEAGIVQDGGTQFIMGDYDTHDIEEFFHRLLERSDAQDKQALVDQLISALRS